MKRDASPTHALFVFFFIFFLSFVAELCLRTECMRCIDDMLICM